MTNEEIKARIELLYKTIREADKSLKEIRSQCKHEKTSLVNYEWRIGSIWPADVCDYCGECLKLHGLEMNIVNSSDIKPTP